jgi:hypothetical protein
MTEPPLRSNFSQRASLRADSAPPAVSEQKGTPMTFFARTTPEETAIIDKIAGRIMADPELSPYANN